MGPLGKSAQQSKARMMDRTSDKPTTVTAEEARQGRIVLNSPRRRMIFLAGLAALILAPLIGIMIWH